jgi:hypothetical protein
LVSLVFSGIDANHAVPVSFCNREVLMNPANYAAAAAEVDAEREDQNAEQSDW